MGILKETIQEYLDQDDGFTVKDLKDAIYVIVDELEKNVLERKFSDPDIDV